MSQKGIQIAAFVFDILQQAKHQLFALGGSQPTTSAGQQDILLAQMLNKANDTVKDEFSRLAINNRLPPNHPAGNPEPVVEGVPTMGPPGSPWPPTNPIPDAWLARIGSEVGMLRGHVADLMKALQEIRRAGYNEHPTAIWMQKVAAAALETEKFNHPGEQPAVDELLPDEDVTLTLAILHDGTIAGALPTAQYQGHDCPYPDGFEELNSRQPFDLVELTCVSALQAAVVVQKYDPRKFKP